MFTLSEYRFFFQEVPVWHNRLRIQHCQSCGIGHNCSMGLITSQGTSTCHECSQKNIYCHIYGNNIPKEYVIFYICILCFLNFLSYRSFIKIKFYIKSQCISKWKQSYFGLGRFLCKILFQQSCLELFPLRESCYQKSLLKKNKIKNKPMVLK